MKREKRRFAGKPGAFLTAAVMAFTALFGSLTAMAAPADGYYAPDSDSRYLSVQELNEYTDYEQYIIENEILARYGQSFNDSDLQMHFDNSSWYYKQLYSGESALPYLNEYERGNYLLVENILNGADRAVERSYYVLPYSNERKLTQDDLYGLSAAKLRIARNEIYARHGRRFNSADLQQHFDTCPWYSGTVSADSFQDSVLSDVERYNVNFISEFEQKNPAGLVAPGTALSSSGFPAAYDSFLSSDGWKMFTTDWSAKPFGYLVIDINQDGYPEILIQCQAGSEYTKTLVFTLQNNGTVIFVDEIYHAGKLYYEPNFQTLVYTPFQLTSYHGEYDYVWLFDHVLYHGFQFFWDAKEPGSKLYPRYVFHYIGDTQDAVLQESWIPSYQGDLVELNPAVYPSSAGPTAAPAMPAPAPSVPVPTAPSGPSTGPSTTPEWSTGGGPSAGGSGDMPEWPITAGPGTGSENAAPDYIEGYIPDLESDLLVYLGSDFYDFIYHAGGMGLDYVDDAVWEYTDGTLSATKRNDPTDDRLIGIGIWKPGSGHSLGGVSVGQDFEQAMNGLIDAGLMLMEWSDPNIYAALRTPYEGIQVNLFGDNNGKVWAINVFYYNLTSTGPKG